MQLLRKLSGLFGAVLEMFFKWMWIYSNLMILFSRLSFIHIWKFNHYKCASRYPNMHNIWISKLTHTKEALKLHLTIQTRKWKAQNCTQIVKNTFSKNCLCPNEHEKHKCLGREQNNWNRNLANHNFFWAHICLYILYYSSLFYDQMKIYFTLWRKCERVFFISSSKQKYYSYSRRAM